MVYVSTPATAIQQYVNTLYVYTYAYTPDGKIYIHTIQQLLLYYCSTCNLEASGQGPRILSMPCISCDFQILWSIDYTNTPSGIPVLDRIRSFHPVFFLWVLCCVLGVGFCCYSFCLIPGIYLDIVVNQARKIQNSARTKICVAQGGIGSSKHEKARLTTYGVPGSILSGDTVKNDEQSVFSWERENSEVEIYFVPYLMREYFPEEKDCCMG